MKKTILLLALFAGINSISAQENIVKATLNVGNAGIQYERSLSKHFSVLGQVGLGFGFTGIGEGVNHNRATGMAYMLEARYYFSSTRDKMEGWYIAPSVNHVSVTGQNPYYTRLYARPVKENYNANIFSLTTGRQWILESKLTFGFRVGVGYENKIYNKVQSDDINLPIAIQAGISLGYAF